MKIETYEIEPVDQTEIQALAADGEVSLIIDKLGLDGQRALLGNPSGTPFPYRRMTKKEQRVYEFHCPIKTELAKYKSDIIPLRVLQVAAHVAELGFCDKGLWVWHPEDAKLDPVLVGLRAEHPFGLSIYILARWGAVWKDFNQLLTEAKAGWITKRQAAIKKTEHELRQAKECVTSDAELFFAGDIVTTSFYI